MSEFIPKEIVKQAKQIDLLTYFMNNNPSELVKKGASTYSLKSHDSVIISNGLWHRFSTNEAGKTAVDYLMKVEKMTLQEAVKNVLNKDISTYKVHKTEINNVPRKIIIPEKASTNKEVIDYLKNRGIDEDIILDCINQKLIYQENKTNNVVFVGYDYDHNIKYAGCRSTNEKRIMRDAKGSSKKTEKEYFVTGINCELDSVYEEMQDTKRYYNKGDKILAYHAYQSFKAGEVTPELAHKIGVQLANEMWGDRFQVIVTTHLNTNHIHNHLVLNSVSYTDGKKYYSNRANTGRLRHTSDEICREYGLSVLEEKPCKKSKINFENYYKKSFYNDNYTKNADFCVFLPICTDFMTT